MRGQRHRVHRTAGGRRRGDGRQGAGEGEDARGGCPARSWRGRRVELRGAATRRGRRGLPRPAQGDGRGRRERDAARRLRGRDRRCVRCCECGGGGGIRRRCPLRREAHLARASRRDPGALRRRGRCAHAGGARVLDPATSSEARRGVAVGGARSGDARGDGGDRRTRMRGHRLPQRRHVRVSRRPGRRLLLHRGELSAPGRASGLGARHRHRHRPRADPTRRRRAARDDGPCTQAWARARDPDQRRGSRARLSPGARDDRRASTFRSGRVFASTPPSARDPRSRPTTTR